MNNEINERLNNYLEFDNNELFMNSLIKNMNVIKNMKSH